MACVSEVGGRISCIMMPRVYYHLDVIFGWYRKLQALESV